MYKQVEGKTADDCKTTLHYGEYGSLLQQYNAAHCEVSLIVKVHHSSQEWLLDS